MCSGAILWSWLPLVVYGTSIAALKRLGLPQTDLPTEEVAVRSSFGGFETVAGVLEGERDTLFGADARRMGSG